MAKVADIQGDWYFSAGNGPEEKVTQWQRLPLDGAIRVKSPSSQDYIVIVGMDDKILEERRCGNLSSCNHPIYLSPAAKETEAGNGMFSKLWQRLWSDPDRYSMHRQRDIFDETVAHTTDGVISLREGRVELASIMAGLATGHYYLYFARDPGDANSGEPIGPVVLNWNPASPARVVVRDLKVGIYETGLLSRKSADEPFKRTGRPSWALVCSAETYPRAAVSFTNAVTVSNNWGTSISRETKLSFLRAELAELADTSCRPSK